MPLSLARGGQISPHHFSPFFRNLIHWERSLSLRTPVAVTAVGIGAADRHYLAAPQLGTISCN